MHDRIKAGDIFKCKRRGHTVKVEFISNTEENQRPFVSYTNVRGRRATIFIDRLLNASRFERLVSPVVNPVPEHSTVA